MCGVAGILGRPAADTSAALLRMQACLRHRGPDGEGAWRSPSGIAAFAHTRLAVIDPSPAARQPMSSANGNLTIVFSGEIYNFRELRRELEHRGAAFRTESDTEVILHGYEMHGAEFITRLRGMFAFALWNERERSSVLARDAFGLKPLYFHHGLDGMLTFASEVRALSASGTMPLGLDARGLHGYLRTGSVPEPRTLLKGVSALEAGRVLTWRAGRVTTRTYRTLQFTGESPGNHHADTVRAAITDSVRHHFVSDVPVGILLSGGVDSAALLALATENGQRGVRTVSMALPGSVDDEGPLARRTAERFGSEHLELAMTAGAARSLFPSYLDSIDQPSIDGFNVFAVSRFARERGLKVVLSGVGADEVFGGYSSFTLVPRITGWNARLARMGPLRPLGGRALEALATAPRWRRVGELLQQPPTLTNTYAMFRGIFTNREAAVIAKECGVDAVSTDSPADEPIEAPTPEDAVSSLELTRYVRNQLAREGDAASMACAVELRAPFLDLPLFETLAGIPSAIRLAGAKRLLRDAVPELPEWAAGPKRCFQFPFGDWMNGEWQPVFADVDATSPVPMGTWYRKLCVLVLKHWMKRTGINGG